jgi:ribosomal protein S18 acetylase RimI-like enzyme
VIEPWEHGTVFRAPALAGFWDYNGLCLEGPAASVGVDTLVHTADVRLGDLDHRRVEVDDEAAGARLRPGFAALGWTTERLVWMWHAGPPPPGAAFAEVPFSATRGLRIEWTRSALPSSSEAVVRGLALQEEMAAERRGSRALVADGGFAIFLVHGDVAEIDQVYVTPGRRGRGLGGALVAAAVRAAGAAETFIVAEDGGAATRLYARLGFRPVWRQHTFTRRPG